MVEVSEDLISTLSRKIMCLDDQTYTNVFNLKESTDHWTDSNPYIELTIQRQDPSKSGEQGSKVRIMGLKLRAQSQWNLHVKQHSAKHTRRPK